MRQVPTRCEHREFVTKDQDPRCQASPVFAGYNVLHAVSIPLVLFYCRGHAEKFPWVQWRSVDEYLIDATQVALRKKL